MDQQQHYQIYLHSKKALLELAGKINNALNSGKEDDVRWALSMNPQLELLQAEEKKANDLCKVALGLSSSAPFKMLLRSEFDRLPTAGKTDFILSGGRLFD